MTRFIVKCILIVICTLISYKLLEIVDYELTKKLHKLIFVAWCLIFFVCDSKTEAQREYEQDKWDFIRITEGRKNWERYLNSDVKDRIRGHKRIVLSKEELQNK